MPADGARRANTVVIRDLIAVHLIVSCVASFREKTERIRERAILARTLVVNRVVVLHVLKTVFERVPAIDALKSSRHLPAIAVLRRVLAEAGTCLVIALQRASRRIDIIHKAGRAAEVDAALRHGRNRAIGAQNGEGVIDERRRSAAFERSNIRSL